ncbi:hypothetical protein [Brucella intermedia]|uniref:hypothetical protein n=1 Tax=Brucella intermedia TaxID=94625 RepID=UPI00224A65CC|nr:hypothetical protein [Brucella intermedia]
MAVLPDYVTGTITLANGSTTVTGTGTMFATAAFRPGDTLQIQNLTAIIASVNSNTSLTLTAPWTGTSLTNAPYRARYLPDGARVTAQTTTLIELLGNGVLSNIASVPVEDGKLLVGNTAGQYETISKDELGIQDPNGSLGKLAGLTLGNRQILQTDDTGALTALTLAARQILQTDVNGALTPISLTANKTLRTDANADIVLANVEKPLLAAYGGSDVAGLSQIVLDIPNEYVGAEVEMRCLRTQTGSGIYGFRCGPSGGTLLTSYRIREWNQYGTGDLTWAMNSSVDAGQVATFSEGLSQFCRATFNFGTGASGWMCQVSGSGWTSGGGFAKTDRSIWCNTNGVMRRLAIVSTVPFGNASETSVRIYGVR